MRGRKWAEPGSVTLDFFLSRVAAFICFIPMSADIGSEYIPLSNKGGEGTEAAWRGQSGRSQHVCIYSDNYV